MQLSAEPSRVFRFAGFELDTRTRELRAGLRRIRLQEQPFEILRMLLERPGDVVTRDELQQRLWSDGTFVDFEHALNAAVKRLRAALGDDAENPRFVETLPRRGYRFIATLDRAENVTVLAPVAPPAQPRLAVLPFMNLSDDPSQEYFSDGLTEELIAQLGAICRGRVGVLARWSSMTFKGTSQRAKVIGETLRANFLLEGSVRREDDRVRITATLIDAANETQIWTNSYERELSDCCNSASGRLSVQTDVASCVARALAVALTPSLPAPTAPALTPAAYQSYLKGRYHWNTRGSEGLGDALAAFARVVDEMPVFGAGHAALARTRIAFAESYQRAPRPELTQARDAALRALELDPDLAEAHLAMGDVHRLLNWDWRSAEASYARAVLLNPSLESVHRSYGALLVSLDRSDEAVREVEHACDLDPLCLISTLSAAWVHYLLGDDERAAEKCRHSIDMDPGRVHAHRLLGAALLHMGDHSNALAALETALMIAPDDPMTLAWLAHARGINGDRSAANALVQRLMSSTAYVSPYHAALAHTGLGDGDAAFAALDAACIDRDPMVALIAVEPRFAPLHRDPRWARLRDYLKLDRPAA